MRGICFLLWSWRGIEEKGGDGKEWAGRGEGGGTREVSPGGASAQSTEESFPGGEGGRDLLERGVSLASPKVAHAVLI